MKLSTIQEKLDAMKELYNEAQDQYSFALARGDLHEISFRKAEVQKYLDKVGHLVKLKLKAQAIEGRL